MALFAKFGLHITIYDESHSKGSYFVQNYAAAIRARQSTLSTEPENLFLPRVTLYPEVFILSRIRSIASTHETNAYISDYNESDGSLIITATIILETLINYNHIKEAIEAIEEDLRSSLNLPGYTAHISIKGNAPCTRTSTNHHGVALAYARLGIILIALVGGLLLALHYLNEEKKAEKIEVTITNNSGHPITIPSADTIKGSMRQ